MATSTGSALKWQEGTVPTESTEAALLDVVTAAAKKVTEEPRATTVKDTTIALETTAATTTTTTEPTTQIITTTTPLITTQAAKDETTKAPIVETTAAKITQPPYQIVTEGGIDSSTTASNGTMANEQGGPSAASVGIIAGVVSGLLLLVIIIIVVVILLRRRKKRKSNDIVRMENPNYGKPARDYRFSRDSSLYVGPTVDIQSFKPSGDDSPSNSKKKRSAPQPPTSSQKKKRAAPVPPNPFGDGDYYEKDSHGSIESLELSTFTARNDNTKDSEASEPLMKKNDRNGNLQHEDSAGSEEESNNHSTFQPNSVGKSLDEYDKTRNPFFAE